MYHVKFLAGEKKHICTDLVVGITDIKISLIPRVDALFVLV